MLSSISAIAQSEQTMRYLTGVAQPNTNLIASVTGTSTSPIIPAATTTTANLSKTEMSQLFDGDIWVIPYTHSYDFGVITTPVTYSFNIYNSGDTAVTLNSISASNAEGTVVTGTDVPYNFPANATRSFTISATVEGDLNLDGYYTFVFDTQTVIFTISGTRAIILSILPTQNYSESEKYETNIFSAQDGTENRQQIVGTPKRFIEYDIIPDTNQKVELLEEIIAYALRFYCLQPLWFSYTQVTTTQSAYTINCDTSSRDFTVGGYALIRKEFNDYEFAVIDSFISSSITFTKSVAVEAGDIIVPLLRCTPESSNSFTFYNSDVAAFKFKFKELL